MKFNFCVACLATDDLHHHHLVARVNGGSDDDTNLITLCYSCHRAIHGQKTRGTNHKELCRAGREKAMADGKHMGRPQKIDMQQVIELRNKGTSIAKTAKVLGCSIATVKNLTAKAKAQGLNKDFHSKKSLSELSSHKELQRVGIDRAKAEGKYKGKQVSPKTIKKVNDAMLLIEQGETKENAAKSVGIGIATLYRYISKRKHSYTDYIT